MQYPIIDLITSAYLNNGWTGFDIPNSINISYKQEGTGIPSPDNVRPIIPGAVLNIGGQNMPVYHGTLDTQNRTLTVDFDYVDISTSTIVNRASRYSGIVLATTDIMGNLTLSKCSFLDRWSGGAGNIPLNNFNIYYSSGYNATQLILNMGNTVDAPSQNAKRQMIEAEIEELKAQNKQLLAIYNLSTPYIYNLTSSELSSTLETLGYGIAHRLKLPLPHYFPHPVIDALQRAAAGTQTADDTEILQHYLTPLGIGGI